MSESPIKLSGIAWDHSRAFPPLVATAQRYEETHPGVRIEWRKRTLDEFGHKPIDELAGEFDLIVIDHPWAGFAFNRGLIHDLEPLIDAAVTEDLAANSIGLSYESYVSEDRLMAVPIDAATPAASWRPDLLERLGAEPPKTWGGLIELAERGVVAMPGFSADVLLNFAMFAHALGGGPFTRGDRLADRNTGRACLDQLRRLGSRMPAEAFDFNPIQLAEAMTTGDANTYCPFAYTYRNYCRGDFTNKPLRYGELVTLDDGVELRSIIGGTGLAVSTSCRDPEAAAAYAGFVAAGSVQKGLYLHAGGQPAHVAAWNDPEADRFAGGFFTGCRRAQERALLRPRYDGYVPLQKSAGEVIRRCVRDGGDPDAALDEVDRLYRDSLTPAGG